MTPLRPTRFTRARVRSAAGAGSSRYAPEPEGITAEPGTVLRHETAETTRGLSRQHSRGSGVLMVLGSCLSLQLGAAFATLLFPVIGAWGTTSIRLGVSAVLLVAVFRPRVWRWSARQWWSVIGFGAALAAMNGFFYAAIERIPLGIAVCMEFLGPLTLAALLSRRWREGLWIVLALAGIALFFVDDFTSDTSLDLVGVAFVLVAGFFWALYILGSQRVGRLVPGGEGLAGAMVVGALLLLPFGLPTLPVVVTDLNLLGIAAATGLLASVIPYSLEFVALRRLTKPVFSILLSLEPVFATAAGLLVLGQGITLLAVAAVVLVVGASVGSTLMARDSSRTT